MQYIYCILPNISSKGSQTLKFDQSIEHNITKIFHEKSYAKCGRELFADPFLKNQIWAYLWINSLKLYRVSFYCMPSWGLSKDIEISCKQLAFTLCKAFLKNKKRSGTSRPASFSAWFLKKNISLAIFYQLPKFH